MSERAILLLQTIDQHFLNAAIRAEEMAELTDSIDLPHLSEKLRAFSISSDDRGRAMLVELRELSDLPRSTARDLRAAELRDAFQVLATETDKFYNDFAEESLQDVLATMMAELERRRQSRS